MDDSRNIDWTVMGPIYQAEAQALREAKIAGNFADTGEKMTNNTDRTESTIELVEKIEELTKWLDMKTEYIATLEARIAELENEK